jgi:RNA polymerase sigma factor (sigma-70 family)
VPPAGRRRPQPDERLPVLMAITCMTDAEAMAALSRGEIAALDSLVIRHNDRAQGLAFGVLRDPSLTHDVVADSFLAAAASARRFDPSRPFQPWFDRIVVNRAIKESQRERRHRRLAAMWRRPAEADDPSRLAELGELRGILVAAFARLEPRDRAVVTLRLVLGASEKETADVLGCPVGTIKSRLARARIQLHGHLAQAGVAGAFTVPIGESQ